jgi:hypothetical protein
MYYAIKPSFTELAEGSWSCRDSPGHPETGHGLEALHEIV